MFPPIRKFWQKLLLATLTFFVYAQKSAFDMAKRDLESFPTLNTPFGMAYRKAIRKYAPNSPYIPAEYKGEDDSIIDFAIEKNAGNNSSSSSDKDDIAKLKQQIQKLKQDRQQQQQTSSGGIHSRLQHASASLSQQPQQLSDATSDTSATELQEYEPLSTRRRRRGRYDDGETLKD